MGIVRALFATSPGLGHVFPTISLAHALRAAGHEVLVATAGGKEAANAGLHVVDTAPGVDIGAVFQQAASEQPEEFDYSTDVDTEKGLEFVGAIFAKLSGVSVDLTVSAAESWRPDVVVYSSMEGTGPLVAATLGTVLTQVGALTSLTKLVDVARHLDAEFVLALGDADPSPLGELPDNVRAAGWVPLSALLPTCAALVHHGGAGSTLTAIDAGVTQLVLPHGADQYMNADAVARRGLGLRSEPDQVDAELIDRLLTDPGLGRAASEVADEIATLPRPADLVPKIAGLKPSD